MVNQMDTLNNLKKKYKDYQFLIFGEQAHKLNPDNSSVPFTFLPKGWHGQDWLVAYYEVEEEKRLATKFKGLDLRNGKTINYSGIIYVYLKETN